MKSDFGFIARVREGFTCSVLIKATQKCFEVVKYVAFCCVLYQICIYDVFIYLILQELNTTPVLEKKTEYRHNWVKHVHRMNNSRFPKALIEYHPRGRRRPDRPLKRLLDGVQIEAETGHMGLIS
jgi:hypothetical protein